MTKSNFRWSRLIWITPVPQKVASQLPPLSSSTVAIPVNQQNFPLLATCRICSGLKLIYLRKEYQTGILQFGSHFAALRQPKKLRVCNRLYCANESGGSVRRIRIGKQIAAEGLPAPLSRGKSNIAMQPVLSPELPPSFATASLDDSVAPAFFDLPWRQL